MDITIDKSSVFESVKMNVSIVGRSYKDADGNSLWDRIGIQARDEDLMEKHWDSAYGSVLASLENFLTGHTGTTLSIDDKRRINGSAASDLSETVGSYLTNRMTAEWMKLKAVEYAGGYANAADVAMQNLLGKVRVKTEPVLKKFNT